MFAVPWRKSYLGAPLLLYIPPLFLLLAYLKAVQERRVRTATLPAWYGRGPVPLDRQYNFHKRNATGQEPVRVLYFIDLPPDSPLVATTLETLEILEADRRFEVTAASSLASDEGTSKREHLETRSCSSTDLVWRIGADPWKEGGCDGATWISEIYSNRSAEPEDAFAQAVDERADITLIQQPSIMMQPAAKFEKLKEHFGDTWRMGLHIHALPAARWVLSLDVDCSELFYPSRYSSLRDVLYIPNHATPPSDYPKLPWGRSWSMLKPHHFSPSIKSQDPLRPGGRYRTSWRYFRQHRARRLRRAGICLFEDWHLGILTQGMAEAMLSGCIVAATVPDVDTETLREAMLILPQPTSLPPELPDKVVNSLLAGLSNTELEAKALRAFQYAREKLSVEAKVEDVATMHRRWMQGERGYMWPHSFRYTCRSGYPKPAWCDE